MAVPPVSNGLTSHSPRSQRDRTRREDRHFKFYARWDNLHDASRGTYGARRVTAELRLAHATIVGHNAVASIMGELGLQGLPTRRKPKNLGVNLASAADLVKREFARNEPNRLWMTDITEHPTREGKVYCCVVLDAFSRKVIGWSIDSTQTATLVTNALGMAITARKLADHAIIHSDRGVHVLGVQREGPQRRSRSLDGSRRLALRQRDDGGVLGENASRATQ